MDDQELRASALRSAVLLTVGAGEAANAYGDQVQFHALLRLADRFEECIRDGFLDEQPAPTDAETGDEPESDEHFRRRILNTSGRSTVHYQRILTDTGARLDEVASFYDLKRRGT